VLAIVLLCAAIPVSSARAVILYSSSTRNTSAPRGSLANSGWQWEGQLGGVLGTVISKKYIITASHFNAAVGTSFDIGGTKHRTVDMWDDPNTDLRIYKCVGTFDSWAALVKTPIETNRTAMMIGRGGQRGDDVMANGQLKGWQWGFQDGVQSWGRNNINGTVDGGAGFGSLLQMDFNANGVGYEGAYSRGDSGGGLFVKVGTKWLLAGVAYSADGPYSTSSDGSNVFDASLFDRGGLWQQGMGIVSDAATDLPSGSYATRISTNLTWIGDVLSGKIAPSDPKGGIDGHGVPEPSALCALTVAACATILRSRPRRHR